MEGEKRDGYALENFSHHFEKSFQFRVDALDVDGSKQTSQRKIFCSLKFIKFFSSKWRESTKMATGKLFRGKIVFLFFFFNVVPSFT